jgi:protein Mpv17
MLLERYDAADANVLNTALLTAWHHLTQYPLQWYQSYEATLAANPVATKAATSATVYTIGDVIAQYAEQLGSDDGDGGHRRIDLDAGRVVRSLVAGGVGHGPLSHVWYHVSEHFFTNLGMTQWWSVFPKIAADQVVWGTIWNSLYLMSVGTLQLVMTKKQDDTVNMSSGITKVFHDTKSSIFPLFVDGLKLWPFAHIITYGIIPVEDRLLWVDAVEIIWVSIMATKAAETAASSSKTVEMMDDATNTELSATAPASASP